jgi:hypothetical protein
MAKMRIHGALSHRIKVLDKELPTLRTPWGDLDPWLRENVMPKLDIAKKWMGCWMWTGANFKNGEPKMGLRDNFTRKHGRIGELQTLTIKIEIMKLFLNTDKIPRRVYRGKDVKDAPDVDVVHLCGHLSCLNPAHFICSVDDARGRDNEALRDQYLTPGSYYVA